ncbi:MAG: hypothetical protein AB1815_05790 [Bacillota bacterium]
MCGLKYDHLITSVRFKFILAGGFRQDPESFITGLNRPKTPASVGGGFQRAVKSSMDSANIQRGLNPPLNEVSFNKQLVRAGKL